MAGSAEWGRGIGSRTALATSVTLLIALSSFGKRTFIIPFLAGIIALVGVDGTLGESLAKCRGLTMSITGCLVLMYPAWLFRTWLVCNRGVTGHFGKCMAREWSMQFDGKSPSYTPLMALVFVMLIFMETFVIVILCSRLPWSPSPKFAVLGAVVCGLAGTPPHLLWVTMVLPLGISLTAATLPPFDEALAVQRVAAEWRLSEEHAKVALESTRRLFCAGSTGDEDVARYRELARESLERKASCLHETVRLEQARQIERLLWPSVEKVKGGQHLEVAGARLEVALRHVDWLVDFAEDYQENWRSLTIAPRGTLWHEIAIVLEQPLTRLVAAITPGTGQLRGALLELDAAFAAARANVVYGGCASLIRRDHSELIRIYAFLFDFVRAAVAIAGGEQDKTDFLKAAPSSSPLSDSFVPGDATDANDNKAFLELVSESRRSRRHKTMQLFGRKHDEMWWYEPTRLSVAIAAGCALALSPSRTGFNLWLPITSSFCHHRRTSSAFVTSKLRLEGTSLGAIYGLFAVSWATSLTNDHFGMLWRWLVVIFLFPWIAAVCSARHDRENGYAGLVAGFTPLVIVVQSDPTLSFVIRLKSTALGAVLVLGSANVIFPRRAEALLPPKLAIMVGALRDAFSDVSAASDNRPPDNAFAALIAEDFRRLRSALREVKELVAMASLEPTFFGLYPDFDARNHEALVKAFADALLWLDQAATAVDLIKRDANLLALFNNFHSLAYLRENLCTSVCAALTSACRLMKRNHIARINRSRTRLDDGDPEIGCVPLDSKLAPYTLWRTSKKFSALKASDTAHILELAGQHSAAGPMFSNTAALAFLTYSIGIENSASAMATVVACLERIVDDQQPATRAACLEVGSGENVQTGKLRAQRSQAGTAYLVATTAKST